MDNGSCKRFELQSIPHDRVSPVNDIIVLPGF